MGHGYVFIMAVGTIGNAFWLGDEQLIMKGGGSFLK